MVYDRTLHLYIHLKSGKCTLRILLVTFCHQNHLFARKPNVFLWSTRSVWYHKFGKHMQGVTSTKNEIVP